MEKAADGRAENATDGRRALANAPPLTSTEVARSTNQPNGA